MVAGESAAPAAVEMRRRGEGKAAGAAGESAAATSFSIARIEYMIAGEKAAGGRRVKKRRTSSGGSGIEASTSMKGSHGWIGMKSRKRVLKIVVSILSILQPSETASIWVFSEVDDELLRRLMMGPSVLDQMWNLRVLSKRSGLRYKLMPSGGLGSSRQERPIVSAIFTIKEKIAKTL
jgi:hypothetical protein